MSRGAMLKITLDQDYVLGPAVDWGNAGAFAYWDIIKTHENGDTVIKRGIQTLTIPAADMERGRRDSEPNLSMPNGFHVKLEIVQDPGRLKRWWHERRSR